MTDKNKNLSEEDFSPSRENLKRLEESIRKKYTFLKDYKEVTIITNEDRIRMIANKYKEELNNVIYKEKYNDEDVLTDYPYSFTLKKDEYFLFCDYFPLMEEIILVAFIKNKNKFNKDIREFGTTVYKTGVYNLINSSNGPIFSPIKFLPEEDPILSENYLEMIEKDVDRFFKMEKFYIKNSMPFKRGILLYGPPGNGKTTTIKALLKKHRDKYGIIIDCLRDVNRGLVDFIRFSTDGKNKIIIFEDIDSIDSYNRSTILNMLDGVDSITHAFFIATTNSVEKVDRAIINRPSRFDRVYNFSEPNKKSRIKLIKRFFPKEKEVEKLAELTKGFSGAFFKELFIFKNLHNCSIMEAVNNLSKQLKIFNNYDYKNYLG